MVEENNLKAQMCSIDIQISKVCWLIDKNDIDALKTIIQKNYKLYGGLNYLIVPIFNSQIDVFFENCIRKYDPDYYISLIDVDEQLKEKLYSLCTPIKVIENMKQVDKFLESKEIIGKLKGFNSKDELYYIDFEKLESFEIEFVNMLYPSELIEQISTNFNFNVNKKYNDINDFIRNTNIEKELNQKVEKRCSIYQWKHNYKPYDELKYIYKLKNEKEWEEPEDKSLMFGLEERIIYTNSHQIVIGSIKSTEDICTFWNIKVLSKINHNIFWFPVEKIDDETYYSKIIEFAQNKKIDKKWTNLNLCSNTIDNRKLAEIKDRIQELYTESFDEKLSIIVNPKTPTEDVGIQLSLKNYNEIILFSEKCAVIIPQLPDYFEDVRLYDTESICIRIDLTNSALLVNNDTVHLVCDENLCKISNSSIRILYNNHPNSIVIYEPEGIEVIKAAFSKKGFDIVISDKGLIGKKVINLLGSLEKCEIFTRSDLIKLIKHLSNDQREFESLEKIKSFFKDGNVDTRVEELLEKKILFRSYVLKCKDCATVNEISIDKISENNICKGCLSNLKLPLSIEFSYRLNSLIKHAYNHGVITHLTTLLKVHEEFNVELSIPGILIKNLNREIDIVILDTNEIIIGECKNDGGELKNAEGDSIIQIAHTLGSEKVIFGSLEKNFTTAIKNKYKSNKDIMFVEN